MDPSEINNFASYVNSQSWKTAGLEGFRQGCRIAEDIRVASQLDRTDMEGQVASDYLSNVIAQLQKQAEADARNGFGRYRWIWYLRRLPEEVFAGRLQTTGPYDRMRSIVLATRGAGPDRAVGSPHPNGTFPIDETACKRISRICGFTTFFSQMQVNARAVGKNAVLSFSVAVPGLNFPTCITKRDASLESQIHTYDQRNERHQFFSGLGIPLDEYDPDKAPDAPALFLVSQRTGPSEIHTEEVGGDVRNVVARYTPTFLAISDLESLLSDSSILGQVPWSPEISALISLLYAATILVGRSPASRINLLHTGYVLVLADHLDALCRDLQNQPTELKRILRLFPADPTDRSISDQLLEMEGVPSPLLAGPTAFRAGADLIGIDLFHASQRLLDRLRFPGVHGTPARIRARVFEQKVQDLIDASAWAPRPEIKKLIGHQFKRGGKWIGEIDAFAAKNRTLLLVSCKSVIHTAEYDLGIYSVVRNVRTMLEKTVEQYARMEELFREFPKHETEYDFSAYDTFVSVALTPQVMYVNEPLLSQTVFSGLKKYAGFEEFRDWLNEQAQK